MSDSIVRTPWKDYMGEVPMHLEYFDGSMFEAVEQIAKKYPGVSNRDIMKWNGLTDRSAKNLKPGQKLKIKI